VIDAFIRASRARRPGCLASMDDHWCAPNVINARHIYRRKEKWKKKEDARERKREDETGVSTDAL